jgi:hypothetical protein
VRQLTYDSASIYSQDKTRGSASLVRSAGTSRGQRLSEEAGYGQQEEKKVAIWLFFADDVLSERIR